MKNFDTLGEDGYRRYVKRNPHGIRRCLLSWIISVLFLTGAVIFFYATEPITVNFIDVGQGDACFIQGGKGGDSDIKTLKYDLCYPIDSDKYMKKDTYPGVEIGVCRPNESNKTEVGCCNKENGTRTTRDSAATALNLSTFENIKSLVVINNDIYCIFKSV